jgi:hypothetical protein
MSRGSDFRRYSEGDETFTRAAWDAARDAEEMWDARFEVVLSPSRRKGVWNATARLQNCNADGSPRSLVVQVGDYPNSRAAALSSFLYAEANKVLIMASEKLGNELAGQEPGRH